MSNFIGLVYATLKAKGIDTSNMDVDEAVKKFNELNGTDDDSKKAESEEKAEAVKSLKGERDVEDVDYSSKLNKIKQSFGGNSGYAGGSMSKRAVEAYESGEQPMSNWTKDEIIDEVTANSNIASEVLEKYPLQVLKDTFLRQTSWHHTGAFYNKTDFYSVVVDEDFTPDILDRHLQSYREEVARKKEMAEQKKANAKEYVIANVAKNVGSMMHPKKEWHQERGRIEGDWFYGESGTKYNLKGSNMGDTNTFNSKEDMEDYTKRNNELEPLIEKRDKISRSITKPSKGESIKYYDEDIANAIEYLKTPLEERLKKYEDNFTRKMKNIEADTRSRDKEWHDRVAFATLREKENGIKKSIDNFNNYSSLLKKPETQEKLQEINKKLDAIKKKKDKKKEELAEVEKQINDIMDKYPNIKDFK